jgi:hypothetical protein
MHISSSKLATSPVLTPFWIDGPPPQITAATLAIDLDLARQTRCMRCRKAMMGKAQHRGRQYRVLALCGTAGCGGSAVL